MSDEGLVDKIKEAFGLGEDEEIEEPQHEVEDGPERGWSAAEVDPSEYVDDDWIKENTREV